ncbi:MAG: lysine--tRNA ligase [Oscillospiraceae bacterium]|nr:lysine--tRNA ligase [Oscillospiraceae bacterium]
MHWSEKIADELIKRNPDKPEYVCATGISPSGSIHIGNFRDIATSYFVVKALQARGKKARLMHSWDNFDRLRKVPVNVTAIPGAEKPEFYIGYPYADVPSPFGGESYAVHFQTEFDEAMKAFGIRPDYREQTAMYRSGKYTKDVLLAMSKRGEIFDILDSFRTQDATPGERESYFPAAIYCAECKRDTTKIVSYCDESHIAQYECKCGHKSAFDFSREHNCKLAWKVDWAMRWRYEGVDFEPGGQDHASPTGSYSTSKIIAEKIFGYTPPLFQGYGFIGLKGAAGKMSGSTGLNLTPATLLKIYEPEVILWLYHKVEPLKPFDFCFDDGILRQYFEFDKTQENSQAPFSWLVQFGSVVNFNPAVLETVFGKIGTPFKAEQFAARLERAKNWLEMCSPESVNRLFSEPNREYYDTLTDAQKRDIAALHKNLSENEYTVDELNTMLYAVTEKDKALQAAFFKNVYNLLIGKDKGPRLYLFLHALEQEQYLHLLKF